MSASETKAKPTPGPWTVGHDGYNADMVYASGGHGICQVFDIFSHQRVESCLECAGMPNARLIAAAPDLLAALRHARELLEEYARDDGEGFNSLIINAAIARAEG